MAVRLYSAVEELVDKGGDLFVKKVIMTEKSYAPWDTGNLANSIMSIKHKVGSYTVTTNAVGENGVAYPARIEAGQAVYPSGRYMHNFYDGRGLVPAIYYKKKWHEMANPSHRSHFASKTVSRYGG